MHYLSRRLRHAAVTVTLLLFACLVAGCATGGAVRNEQQLPPVLKQDELLRPYQKVATVEVRRKRYGAPEDLTPADYDWAYDALRHEASRIGADAVIVPEVTVETDTYVFFPTSEMKAKGIAIKFQ